MWNDFNVWSWRNSFALPLINCKLTFIVLCELKQVNEWAVLTALFSQSEAIVVSDRRKRKDFCPQIKSEKLWRKESVEKLAARVEISVVKVVERELKRRKWRVLLWKINYFSFWCWRSWSWSVLMKQGNSKLGLAFFNSSSLVPIIPFNSSCSQARVPRTSPFSSTTFPRASSSTLMKQQPRTSRWSFTATEGTWMWTAQSRSEKVGRIVLLNKIPSFAARLASAKPAFLAKLSWHIHSQALRFSFTLRRDTKETSERRNSDASAAIGEKLISYQFVRLLS